MVMLVIHDKDFEKAIRDAFGNDPVTATKLVELMSEGCEQIERFNTSLKFAREAPFSIDATPEDFEAALNEVHESFGLLVDIFGDLLNIATGVANGSEED